MDFKGDKIRSTPSFGGKYLRHVKEVLVGKIQRPFLTRVSLLRH
jgi:hypothetical protein